MSVIVRGPNMLFVDGPFSPAECLQYMMYERHIYNQAGRECYVVPGFLTWLEDERSTFEP